MDKNDNTLYSITDDLSFLDELLEQEGGEVTEEYEKLELELFSVLQDKVDSTCGYVQKVNDLISNAKAQRDRLDVFIKQNERKLERLSDYVKFCLDKTGRDKFVGSLYEMKIRKPTKVLKIDDESLVPMEYTETMYVTKIDKKGLKEAVKSGALELEGISLVDGKRSVSFKLLSGSKKEKRHGEEYSEDGVRE